MKLPTPRRPRVNLRYLLLEKGGGYIIFFILYAHPHRWHRRAQLYVLVMINNAIFYREPSAATKTLGRVIIVVGKLVGDIVPSRFVIFHDVVF